MNENEVIVQELRDAGLDEVDAWRAVFIMRAAASCWTNARIARQLGVSRERIGQRRARLRQIAEERGGRIAKAVTAMDAASPVARPNDSLLSTPRDWWSDIDFARGMVETVG